jgi:hypothetical protein
MSNQHCLFCGRTLTRNEIGLNKKLLGRNVKHFYCIDCLAEYLEVSADELKARIEDFKMQGCTLFS